MHLRPSGTRPAPSLGKASFVLARSADISEQLCAAVRADFDNFNPVPRDNAAAWCGLELGGSDITGAPEFRAPEAGPGAFVPEFAVRL